MAWIHSPLVALSLWQRFWSPHHAFYRTGFLAGLAIVLLCSVLSVFVVSKRMAFIGQGISHAAFGGAGVALLMGLFLPWARTPLGRDLVILVFCVTTALVIGRLARRGHVSEDSAIGIALVAAMALGVILIDVRAKALVSLRAQGRVDPDLAATASFHDLLFGSLLNVSRSDVWVAWGVVLVLLAALAALYKELLFFAFDSEGAAVFGVPATAIHYGFLTAVAIAIVLTMRLMGVILAGAFLILPGTIAMRWSRRMNRVLLIAAGVGVSSLVVGLLVAMLKDYTVGPVIVLVLCLILAVGYLVSRLRQLVDARARRGAAPLSGRPAPPTGPPPPS